MKSYVPYNSNSTGIPCKSRDFVDVRLIDGTMINGREAQAIRWNEVATWKYSGINIDRVHDKVNKK